MKHLRFIYAAAVACALLASQPVLAAELSFDTYGSAVITAGQGTVQESSAEVPGGGSETVHFYGPGGQNAGDSTTPNTVQIRVWRRQRQSAVNRQRRLLAAWWIRQDLW